MKVRLPLLGENKQPSASSYNNNFPLKWNKRCGDSWWTGQRVIKLLFTFSFFHKRFSARRLPDEQMKNQILKVHAMNETLNTFHNISETNMSLWRSHLFLSSKNILQFKYCESSILPVFPGPNLPWRIVADVEAAIFYQSRSPFVRPSACKVNYWQFLTEFASDYDFFYIQPSCSCQCRWFSSCRKLQTQAHVDPLTFPCVLVPTVDICSNLSSGHVINSFEFLEEKLGKISKSRWPSNQQAYTIKWSSTAFIKRNPKTEEIFQHQVNLVHKVKVILWWLSWTLSTTIFVVKHVFKEFKWGSHELIIHALNVKKYLPDVPLGCIKTATNSVFGRTFVRGCVLVYVLFW